VQLSNKRSAVEELRVGVYAEPADPRRDTTRVLFGQQLSQSEAAASSSSTYQGVSSSASEAPTANVSFNDAMSRVDNLIMAKQQIQVSHEYAPRASEELLTQYPCPLPPTLPTSDPPLEMWNYPCPTEDLAGFFAAARAVQCHEPAQLALFRISKPLTDSRVDSGEATELQPEHSTAQELAVDVNLPPSGQHYVAVGKVPRQPEFFPSDRYNRDEFSNQASPTIPPPSYDPE
jgi:hypothetical protein